MKIMDITPYYHVQSGGIKTYLDCKVKMFKSFGVEHVVIIPGKKKRVYRVERSKFYELPSFRLVSGYRFFRSISEINKVIEIEKPDVVELGGTYLLIPFLKRGNYLMSVYYHADARRELSLLPLPEKLKDSLFKIVVENCLKRADLILAPSLRLEKELKALGIDNVVYSPLGIETNLFSPSKYEQETRKVLCPEGKPYLLLYAGRLSPEKGIKTLLKALSLLPEDKFQLIVVGSGPLEFFLRLKQKKTPNLTYLSHLTREKLSHVYASSDIYVSASSFETFGLSFLEAQASGLPVCAFDLNLETQLLKETLALERTPEALAEKILETTSLLNFELREALHRRVKESFDIEKSLLQTLSLYYSVLYGGRRAYTPSRANTSLYVG